MNTTNMYIINYKSTILRTYKTRPTSVHVNNTPNADQDADNAVCIQYIVFVLC